jgi:hypothetical protein
MSPSRTRPSPSVPPSLRAVPFSADSVRFETSQGEAA